MIHSCINPTFSAFEMQRFLLYFIPLQKGSKGWALGDFAPNPLDSSGYSIATHPILTRLIIPIHLHGTHTHTPDNKLHWIFGLEKNMLQCFESNGHRFSCSEAFPIRSNKSRCLLLVL